MKGILTIFLLLVWGAVFNSICAAGPLMVEKNLFANDRKPPSPESSEASAKAAKPGMQVGNFQLDGVIIESNEKRAVLRMKNQPASAGGKKGQPASPFITVREGQMVSDYRVSKIEYKSISLEKDGQTFTVGLFAENKVVTPPTPGAAPTPAPEVPPQETPANQPPGGPPPPGYNPQNPQQPVPGQAVAGGRQRRGGPNVNAPAAEPPINQDPNQAAETIEEEE